MNAKRKPKISKAVTVTPNPTGPEEKKDATFWYVKVPKDLFDKAEEKRESVRASKTSVVMRMIKWYLESEVTP